MSQLLYQVNVQEPGSQQKPGVLVLFCSRLGGVCSYVKVLHEEFLDSVSVTGQSHLLCSLLCGQKHLRGLFFLFWCFQVHYVL